MAQVSDLMGLGMAGALANAVGHTRYPAFGGTPLPGVGTVQVNPPTVSLTSSVTLNPTAGNTAFTLPNPAYLVKTFFLYNPTAVAGVIFPPLGGSMNGTLNGSFAVPANSYVIAICSGMVGGVAQWFAK